MQVVGRKEAFEALLKERGIYKKLGVDRSTVAGWKTRLKEGKLLSEDKMKEMLLKYGCTLVQDEVWDIDRISYEIMSDAVMDFAEEIEGKKIGDSIEADYSTNIDKTLVMNVVNRHAEKIGASISIDNQTRPVVVYKFIK